MRSMLEKEENLENIENLEFQDKGLEDLFGEDNNPFFDIEKDSDDLQSLEFSESKFDADLNDDSWDDIDFSDLSGDFKKGLGKIHKKIAQKKSKRPAKKTKKRLDKKLPVNNRAKIYGGKSPASRVLVPRDRKVIIEGVDKFMLSEDPCDSAVRGIGYHNCKKLKPLVLTFNNNSALDFTLELFNPSTPLDYLYSTSQNINNKISVAGEGTVQYTDVLHNILANPIQIYNARVVVSGDVTGQLAESLTFKNKNIMGEQKSAPLNVALNLDNMQIQSTVVNFDIIGSLNRPFIPNGMDVVEYTVLAGNTVTLAFYFEQKDLKKLLYKNAKESRMLL